MMMIIIIIIIIHLLAKMYIFRLQFMTFISYRLQVMLVKER